MRVVRNPRNMVPAFVRACVRALVGVCVRTDSDTAINSRASTKCARASARKHTHSHSRACVIINKETTTTNVAIVRTFSSSALTHEHTHTPKSAICAYVLRGQGVRVRPCIKVYNSGAQHSSFRVSVSRQVAKRASIGALGLETPNCTNNKEPVHVIVSNALFRLAHPKPHSS